MPPLPPRRPALVGRRLLVTVRAGLVRLFRDSARRGLRLRTGLRGDVCVPAGVPPQLGEEVHHLVQAASPDAFFRALRLAVDVAVGILLPAAAAGLVATRWRRPAARTVPLESARAEGGVGERRLASNRS